MKQETVFMILGFILTLAVVLLYIYFAFRLGRKKTHYRQYRIYRPQIVYYVASVIIFFFSLLLLYLLVNSIGKYHVVFVLLFLVLFCCLLILSLSLFTSMVVARIYFEENKLVYKTFKKHLVINLSEISDMKANDIPPYIRIILIDKREIQIPMIFGKHKNLIHQIMYHAYKNLQGE